MSQQQCSRAFDSSLPRYAGPGIEGLAQWYQRDSNLSATFTDSTPNLRTQAAAQSLRVYMSGPSIQVLEPLHYLIAIACWGELISKLSEASLFRAQIVVNPHDCILWSIPFESRCNAIQNCQANNLASLDSDFGSRD